MKLAGMKCDWTKSKQKNLMHPTFHIIPRWQHTFSKTHKGQGMEIAARTTFLFFVNLILAHRAAVNGAVTFNVGVILDLQSLVGKMAHTSILMAMEDFYVAHRNYTTKMFLHIRDSNADNLQAASEAVDLLENYNVSAIIGPQKSSEASFISDLGNKSQVPVISFTATSPTLSSHSVPYFLRATLSDVAQVNCIAALIKGYGWREVITIYEDTDYGRGIIPYLVDALQEFGASIPYRSAIPVSASSDQLEQELYKLMTMQTRVYIVHMSSSIASTLFTKAKELGMMSEMYAWIVTDGIANIINSLNPSILDAMNGALGVKFYVPKSKGLDDFTARWNNKFKQDYPNDPPSQLGTFELWGYDTIWALAQAAEKVSMVELLHKEQHRNNSTCFGTMGKSTIGPKLLNEILHNKFRGLSGDFDLENRQLQPSIFQIINVVGRGSQEMGFWTAKHGIIRQLHQNGSKTTNANSMPDLNPVIWPVRSRSIVRTSKSSCLQVYDAAIGDITIRYNRTSYADFTLPYTESGVAMIVPVKDDTDKNAWVFLKPLTTDLWFGSIAFFIYTGIVIWLLERRINNAELTGSFFRQLGIAIYFSLFADRERVDSILSRLVVIVWVFVLLVITSSYTANLSSILTVLQLQPTETDVHELIKKDEYVGYHNGSYVGDLLEELGFDTRKTRGYETSDDFADALSKGSKNGGIAAVIHEVPYIKIFLSTHCKGYTMVGPIYKSEGFGFVSYLYQI
ncbi:hypothetical protein HU200_037572 [Digitaria exilis]|uniref:Ionotropic glutamate receptor C-terminal domain-containing protein n=1 Tax=Digitaria exilis TaxID=1010633 RepID=A0A835EJ94_9POAL|nr:hypothetical protein HU200_037572 [Digitaria exilis]